MNWFLLSIISAFGISLIIIEWTYMAEGLPRDILSSTGGLLLLISLWIGYRQHFRSNNYKMITYLYAFYRSVKNYVEWYDSDKATRFINEQKQCLDKLENYLEVCETKFSSNVVEQVKQFIERLKEIVRNLWFNSHNSSQAKRYEIWKNIKFNVMENEINPLYEQLKKNLKII